MNASITAHEAEQKFRKTYNAAAGGFAFIMGLNTLVLLGIGAAQFNDPSPMFGPPGVVIGMGVALLGLTLGVTAVIARKQRWGAVVGLVLIILLALVILADFGTSAAGTESGSSGPSAPLCGLVIMFIIGMQLVRAIRATPVANYTPPAPADYAANPYQPYGTGEPAPAYAPSRTQQGPPDFPQQPPAGYAPWQPQPPVPGHTPPVPYARKGTEPSESYTLGTVGATFLVIGAVLLAAGAIGAVVSLWSETTVDETAWQRVHDPVLGFSLEMPGEPTVETSTPVNGVEYETLYAVERHQYLAEMTCTRLDSGWYFEDDEFRGGLESYFDAEHIVSQSTTQTVVNGIPVLRVRFELSNGEVGVVQGYAEGTDSVVVAVNATSAVDDEVIDRVLNSLQRDQ